MKLTDLFETTTSIFEFDIKDTQIRPIQLKALESYLNKLWDSLGMEVSFGRHFFDRVNDPRNTKQITLIELGKLFQQAYSQYGKKIVQLGPDQEAILSDMETDVNVPFMLKWDKENQKLDLVAKTVMRKHNFYSTDPKFIIKENVTAEHKDGTIAMLHLDDDSAEMLKKWCDNHNIPSIDKNKFHCTVLYSRKPVPELTNLNRDNYDIKATIKGWEQLGDAMVLDLNSPEIVKLHEYMMNKGGTHDYPEFIVHTTIAYDQPENTILPKNIPDFELTFDKLEVKAIDPDFSATAAISDD